MTQDQPTIEIRRPLQVMGMVALASLLCVANCGSFVGAAIVKPSRHAALICHKVGFLDVVETLLSDDVRPECHRDGSGLYAGLILLTAILVIPALYCIAVAQDRWSSAGRANCRCGKGMFTGLPMKGPVPRQVCAACGLSYDGIDAVLRPVAEAPPAAR